MWHWFPEIASTFTQIDSIFMIILWITGFVFVAVEAVLLYFAFRYRHRPGRKAAHIHGNTRLEIVWTTATFLVVLFIAGISIGPWIELRNPERFPPPALTLAITAKQFEWNVTYPGADGRIGTDDDFTGRNQLHVPVGRPVHVKLLAEDVIHSFFLPELRVKQDAVPGMEIPIWFQATRPGEYVLGCAELCGLGHYRMKGVVRALDPSEFDAWHAQGGVAVARPASEAVAAGAPDRAHAAALPAPSPVAAAEHTGH